MIRTQVLARSLLITVNRGCNLLDAFGNKQNVVNGIEMSLCLVILSGQIQYGIQLFASSLFVTPPKDR